MKQSLRKLVRPVGEAFTKVRTLWKRAEALYEDTDNIRVLGNVMNRLGIAPDTMVMLGLPIMTVCEAQAANSDVRENTSITKDVDTTVCAAGLAEMYKACTEEGSLVVERDGESFKIKSEAVTVLDESTGASESQMKKYWSQIFLNCPDVLIDYLAKVTSR